MNLMYITNNPLLAKIAEESGVNWIFIDLEKMGKEKRQGHLDTVISHHNEEDIPIIKNELKFAKLLVRIDPLNKDSKSQIDKVITGGADIIMLPYFKSHNEVKSFLKLVDNRVETCLLLETPEAVKDLDNILKLEGIDYLHIGLNDLHLGYKMSFMFELLANGIVEKIINKVRKTNIRYGFGGIARIGEGTLPASMILKEHLRLGSTQVILSRSFYKYNSKDSEAVIRNVFHTGVKDIRNEIKLLENLDEKTFLENKTQVQKIINNIIKGE